MTATTLPLPTELPPLRSIFHAFSVSTVMPILPQVVLRRTVLEEVTGKQKSFHPPHGWDDLTSKSRGLDGEEIQDAGFNMTNARRRSNSSSYAAGLKDFKTKFEQRDEEVVFEEDIHGVAASEGPSLSRTETSESVTSNDDKHVNVKK